MNYSRRIWISFLIFMFILNGILVAAWVYVDRNISKPYCEGVGCAGKEPDGTNCAKKSTQRKDLATKKVEYDGELLGTISLVNSTECKSSWGKWDKGSEISEDEISVKELSIWPDNNRDGIKDDLDQVNFQKVNNKTFEGVWTAMIELCYSHIIISRSGGLQRTLL